MGDTVYAIRLEDDFIQRFNIKSGKSSMLWYVSRFKSVDEVNVSDMGEVCC